MSKHEPLKWIGKWKRNIEKVAPCIVKHLCKEYNPNAYGCNHGGHCMNTYKQLTKQMELNNMLNQEL